MKIISHSQVALDAMRRVIDTGALKAPPAHLTQIDVDSMRVDLHEAIRLLSTGDLNASPRDFDPSTLTEIGKTVSKFRVDTLLCDVETDGAAPEAEQLFLLGLNALEQAERHFKLAALAQARASADRRLGR